MNKTLIIVILMAVFVGSLILIKDFDIHIAVKFIIASFASIGAATVIYGPNLETD